MKKKKGLKALAVLDVLAFALFVQTVNSACVWHFHQPKVPIVDVNSLRKKDDR